MDAEFRNSSKENRGVHSSPPDDQTPASRKVVHFDNVVGGGAGRHMLVDEGKLRNRLEPYNNIAVIATLLAGFALTIFPSGMDDDLDDSDFPWALTGHVLYNGLMGLSFTINLVVTVMLTMELYFTQLLVARHSVAIAMRYLDSTEYSRRIAVFIFYAVSIPAFLVAFTILLFAALHTTAAIITSLATVGGLVIVLLCIRQYYVVYRKANEGVTSFDSEKTIDGVIVSPSSSRFTKRSFG